MTKQQSVIDSLKDPHHNETKMTAIWATLLLFLFFLFLLYRLQSTTQIQIHHLLQTIHSLL